MILGLPQIVGKLLGEVNVSSPSLITTIPGSLKPIQEIPRPNLIKLRVHWLHGYTGNKITGNASQLGGPSQVVGGWIHLPCKYLEIVNTIMKIDENRINYNEDVAGLTIR